MKRGFLLVAGLTAGAVGAAPSEMQPGLWEVTMTMEMAGMPQAMPPTKMQQCYRPEEVQDLRKTVPQREENCKLSDWKQSGNKVSWKMNCSGESTMNLVGNMTYAGDRYNGVIKSTMNYGGQSMDMTQKIDARRIGDCK
jgi:hypothetical protein